MLKVNLKLFEIKTLGTIKVWLCAVSPVARLLISGPGSVNISTG